MSAHKSSLKRGRLPKMHHPTFITPLLSPFLSRPTPRAPPRMCTKRPRLVFITPSKICATPSHAASLSAAAVAGGASIVQLRDRSASAAALRAAAALIAAALPSAAHLVVNGPSAPSLAADIPGVGVHLREADASEDALRAAADAVRGGLVGVSVHGVAKAVEVAGAMAEVGLEGYLQVGTMFETGSHPGKVPEGLALMKEVREAVGDGTWLVGVGGIGEANAQEVIRAGSDGVAVISGIAAAEDPAQAAASLRGAIDEVCARGRGGT